VQLHVDVTKKLGAFELRADFAVSHDKVGIFGPSGSGKSTLVSMIAGLQDPDNGTIQLDGRTLFDRTTNLPPEHRHIGIVFQQAQLFPHLTVRGNLLYGRRRRPPTERKVDFDRLVDVLQIGGLLERGVRRLSGGEKQRVAIGRAVLSNPRLLLLDEPLSSIDDSLRFQLMPFLKAACETFRIPYIFISHSLVEMRLMSERVVVFAKGVQTAVTDPEHLARSRMGESPAGYINLLRLGRPSPVSGHFAYPWGGGHLLLADFLDRGECIAELSSKDIILFKQHPEAISARNLLAGTVMSLFESGGKIGVELDCGGKPLIAEIVPDAARDLAITPGATLYAAIKATAFRLIDGDGPEQVPRS
jgi:molybdate transport system ATP-binding protein